MQYSNLLQAELITQQFDCEFSIFSFCLLLVFSILKVLTYVHVLNDKGKLYEYIE